MPRITTDQLAQMTQREFERVHDALGGLREEVGGIRQEMREGFNDLTVKLDELSSNLSKTLMLWDRRFSDHQASVDAKLRAFGEMLAGK